MNRKDLQFLSRVRLTEARALLNSGHPDGAYYLAGYAVECALKACIAKATQRHEFPDKKSVDTSHSHSLRDLLRVAKLELPHSKEGVRDPIFLERWDLVQRWSETSRYRKNDRRKRPEIDRSDRRPAARGDGLDKAALVAVDFGAGLEVVQALDRAALSIRVAMWAYLSDYEDWRFLLASRRLDEAKGSSAYGLVRSALAASGITVERTPTLLILEMYDPFIRALRRMFAKAKTVEGMRLGGQLIGDRFLEDALVYRIR